MTALAAGAENPTVVDGKQLTLEGAKRVAAAAAAEAKSHDEGSAIAVVDDGGNLLYLERIDGTFPAGSMISIGKARTAALFKKPTAASGTASAVESLVGVLTRRPDAVVDLATPEGVKLVGGFNAPNRVVVARDAKPGQTIQLAVFGSNGPLSDPPANFIWIKSATLDFFKPKAADPVETVERLDPALDAIVPQGAAIEKLATGLRLHRRPRLAPRGLPPLSDPNHNVIYRWTPDGDLSVHRTHSGYAGADIGEYGQPGSNGLTLGKGEVFYDMTSVPGETALDGLKVDQHGDLYVSGPGGIWILSPEGKHLGTIQAPELPANFAWGDGDGKTLYMTARTSLYRVRLAIAGIRP